MATAEEGLMKKLALYTTLTVLVHVAIVDWHLFVLAKIPPGLTGQQVLSAAVAINVVPLVGLVLLWTHYPRLASVLIFVPLAVGFIAGGFEHFLSNGPGNVFRMAATEWTLPLRLALFSWLYLSLPDVGSAFECLEYLGQVSFRISKKSLPQGAIHYQLSIYWNRRLKQYSFGRFAIITAQ